MQKSGSKITGKGRDAGLVIGRYHPKERGPELPGCFQSMVVNYAYTITTWDPISAGKQTFRLGGRLNQAVRSGQSDQSLTGCG